MKAIDILNFFKDQADWIGLHTVDRVVMGNSQKDIKSVLVSWMSDLRAIKHAIDGEYDLLITHEPTFWDSDELNHLHKLPADDVKLQASLLKKQIIEDSGLVIIRNHDVWDRMPNYGIPWALADFLGFDMEPAVIDSSMYQHRYDINPISLKQLTLNISEKLELLGESQIQVFSAINPLVSKVGIGTGCACSIEIFKSMGCDVSIVCDDGSSYWRDIQWAVEIQHPVIRISHATSEEPGMFYMKKYMNEHLPELKVDYLPHEKNLLVVSKDLVKPPKQLLLSEYQPKTELVLKESIVSKPKYDVIDVHTHFGLIGLNNDYRNLYDTKKSVEELIEAGVKKVVNLDGMWGKELDKMLEKTKPYEEFFITFGTVDTSKLDEKDFETYVRNTIRESKEKGIKGLKFLKDVSLTIKDSQDKYTPIDDQRLKVIWETAAELKLPVLIHIGDPTAFFKPIDQFNERYDELQYRPEWSFHKPGKFTFNQLMKMQENLLKNNPNTTFIIAHGGSYTENLTCVSEWLDKYPNMNVDIAARISELGRQPYTARKFFNKYQDRILFGTDGGPSNSGYPIYYRFLETDDEYFSYSDQPIPGQGRWRIYGIYLEDEVLEKVYFKNAERLILGIGH
jgi:predicted TIM-barrel fold metal-dependent hydrolase/putative NIF3 family GTP cyclohydrolase 1 type 2